MAYVASGYFKENYIQENIYIDWGTKVIHIAKSDMILTQTVPSEIYQLDLNDFRIALKELEEMDLSNLMQSISAIKAIQGLVEQPEQSTPRSDEAQIQPEEELAAEEVNIP